MVPPPVGTEAYELYKLRQKLRKQKTRKEEQLKKRRRLSKPFVAAAVRAMKKQCQEAIDAEVVKKNRLLRQNHAMKKEAEHYARTATELRERLRKVESALKDAKADLKEKAQMRREVRTLNKKLSDWANWWERVESRASPAMMTRLDWLGRGWASSRDRGWGGGQ